MSSGYTLVLGLGVTGVSCVRHLAPRGHVVAMDSRPSPPALAEVRAQHADVDVRVGGFDATVIAGADRIVASPGIANLDALVGAARARGIPVLSDIDLFMATVRAPVLAVTGTNGKSTVTSLTAHLLRGAGVHAVAGGNLGPAALDVIADDVACYVLELSSFQLDICAPLALQAATVLNVTADHLDRYADMAAYARSKRRIYAAARAAVANRMDAETFPTVGAGTRLVTFGTDAPADGHFGTGLRGGERWLFAGSEPLIEASALTLRGGHNEQNALASLALVAECGVSVRVASEHLRTFDGLPHRCQLVAVEGGVEFVDDSKATNIGATLAALAGIAEVCRGRVVLIAGGDGKGADFGELASRLPVDRMRAVITIGRDGPRIARALADRVPTHECGELRPAVAHARAIAQDGDCVLLAPACASFDQFRNFEDRGRQFRSFVLAAGSR